MATKAELEQQVLEQQKQLQEFESQKQQLEMKNQEVEQRSNQLQEKESELEAKEGELQNKELELQNKELELENQPELEIKKDDVLEDKIIQIELSEEEKENRELRKGRVTEYKVPVSELGHVHVELESVQMGANFKKKSKPMIQKFDVRAWNNFRKQVVKLGFNHVKVLHAPEGTNIEIGDPKKDEKIVLDANGNPTNN